MCFILQCRSRAKQQTVLGLVGGQTHEVDVAGENRGQLNVVAAARCVIEIAITGINAVVTHVIENHQVTRQRIFWLDQDSESSLAVNAVRQCHTKLGKYEGYITRAVKASWSGATKNIRGSDKLGGHLQDCSAV